MKKRMIVFGGLAVILTAGVLSFYFFYLGNPHRQTLATVNGQKITLEQFNQDLARVESPMREMYREDPEKFLEGMVVKVLLVQEAKKQGITPPMKTYKDVGKDNNLSGDEALVAELMKKQFSKPPEVSKEEITKFYEAFKDQMEGKKLAEVSPAIEQLIREGKQQQAVEDFIKDLRSKGTVVINQDRLRKIAAKPPESNTEEQFKKALTSGKPVLVDFGANNCIPCRQLRPVLNELNKEYTGKAEILVIDVYKYQGLAKDYKIALIPTLVFFDAKGKEVFRQMGAMEKDRIVAKLKEAGVGT